MPPRGRAAGTAANAQRERERARERQTVRLRVSTEGGDRLANLAVPIGVSRSKLVEALAGVLNKDLIAGLVAGSREG